ncbi:MAG: glycosyltransferase family 1 protein, partial [bacterium]|nr:glycosyltransferase family 1 protein [bacterium]
MKVALDVKVMSLRAGGIGRYALNLIKGFAKLAGAHEFFLFSGPQTEFDFSLPKHLHLITTWQHIPSSILRSLFFIPLGLNSVHADIFHGIDYGSAPLFLQQTKLIVTIHDLAVFRFPQMFTGKQQTIVKSFVTRAVKKAAKIIADSENTKADLCYFLNLDPENIEVIYLACDSNFAPVAKNQVEIVKRKYALADEYMLTVGTIEPRKNLLTLLQAYSLLRKEGACSGVKLVIVGQKGWLYTNIKQVIYEHRIEDDVIFLGFIEDTDLPAIYTGARFFVYPSLYEGFGLPTLEAMSCGTPVITSNSSSLPEVVGNAGILVDPR